VTPRRASFRSQSRQGESQDNSAALHPRLCRHTACDVPRPRAAPLAQPPHPRPQHSKRPARPPWALPKARSCLCRPQWRPACATGSCSACAGRCAPWPARGGCGRCREEHTAHAPAAAAVLAPALLAPGRAGAFTGLLPAPSDPPPRPLLRRAWLKRRAPAWPTQPRTCSRWRSCRASSAAPQPAPTTTAGRCLWARGPSGALRLGLKGNGAGSAPGGRARGPGCLRDCSPGSLCCPWWGGAHAAPHLTVRLPFPAPLAPSFELSRYELQDPGMQEMLSKPGAIKGGYLLIEPLKQDGRCARPAAVGPRRGRWAGASLAGARAGARPLGESCATASPLPPPPSNAPAQPAHRARQPRLGAGRVAAAVGGRRRGAPAAGARGGDGRGAGQRGPQQLCAEERAPQGKLLLGGYRGHCG
jgi:hypothetical protein